jgi:organic radical activating enzyme
MSIEFKYPVTEIFSSVQGEGGNAGRSATFLRFGGCNLVCPGCDEPLHDSGTNWVRLTAEQIGDHLVGKQKFAFPADEHFPKKPIVPTELLVITGGEPTLYPLDELVKYLRGRLTAEWPALRPSNPFVAERFIGPLFCIETNGTRPISEQIDYVCVSPKPENFGRNGSIVPHDPSAIDCADEIKLVVGWSDVATIDAEIDRFMTANPYAQIYLSPLTQFPGNLLIPETADQAVDAVMRNAAKGVRLSLQTHKWLRVR